MAEGILKSLDPMLNVYSAGTSPAAGVHPLAIKVMNEIGVDISSKQPKSVEKFLDKSFDYVITVCDNAKETCPVFIGKVLHRLHIGFDDPSEVIGNNDEKLAAFRRTREEIREKFTEFCHTEVNKAGSKRPTSEIRNS